MRKSFVIDSLASCKQIFDSPLNKSVTKHLWSFGKQRRFSPSNPLCHSIYNIPSTFKKIGPAIGYGSKVDFTKGTAISPGYKYEYKSSFEKDRQLRRGYSMIQTNQKLPRHSYIELEPLQTPSPTHYVREATSKGLSYTMRMKTKTIDKSMSIEPQKGNPGPGRYENPEQLSPNGRYLTSKQRGSGATKFNPKSSKRFLPIDNVVPGPGTYNDINNISDSGAYLLSTSRGSGRRKIDHQKRVVLFQRTAQHDANPGPGSYRAPSDFGIYDGDVYKRLPSQKNFATGYSSVTPHHRR